MHLIGLTTWRFVQSELLKFSGTLEALQMPDVAPLRDAIEVLQVF